MLALCAVTAQAGAEARPDWSSWVLKVEVVRLDGMTELGSGVTIGPQRIVTNCHVVRQAGTIHVIYGNEAWPASMDSGDEYRDLCFLKVPGFPGKVPPIGEPEDARVGIPVVAAGYSGGNFAVSKGEVKGLFTCACDGGRVIQTSAHFEPGASGGGLFDGEGRLLGILTYKSGTGGSYHFAIPVGWMKQASKIPPLAISGKSTFWESVTKDSGYFLLACDLGAKKQWGGLLDLANEWIRQEPDNPQAWMAWGRSNLNLGHPIDAVKGFQKVLLLDSTHAEALWELQQLELDLGQSFTGEGH
ncbi:MAG: trypsin-like peptidase domain-containing protein [Thiobacillus sp.]|nr:trypsin-like peptidase domain-containing protein [Thiobacillus sp.]